jgi:hypothetical protein
MSIAELVNAPVEVTIGGRKLKLQRLTISELFAPAQAKILQDYRNNVAEMSKVLNGAEKMEFLKGANKDTPKGAELDKLVNEYYASTQGGAEALLRAFNKHQTISELELTDLILRATEDEKEALQNAIQYAMGDEDTEDKKKLTQVAELVKPQI